MRFNKIARTVALVLAMAMLFSVTSFGDEAKGNDRVVIDAYQNSVDFAVSEFTVENEDGKISEYAGLLSSAEIKTLDRISLKTIEGGTEISPSGKVWISIEIPDGYEVADVEMLRILSDGTVEYVSTVVEGNSLSAYTDVMGLYAIVTGDVSDLKPQEERIKLEHGVGIEGLNYENYESYTFNFNPEYYKEIKARGFDHVRLPSNWMYRGRYGWYYFRDIDRVVDMALEAGLAVILDFHGAESEVSREYDKYWGGFLDMWETLAIRYQKFSDNVCFELLNEPFVGSASYKKLNKLMNETIDIIRETNPTRRILYPVDNLNRVSTLEKWKTIPDIVDMPTVEEDPNLIVAVHMYEPDFFTQQGSPFMEYYRDVRMDYGEEVEQTILNNFKIIDEWRAAHGNREVIVTEFGVVRAVVPSEECAAYTEYFAKTAAKYEISWTYWEMFIHFALFDLNTQTWREDTTGGLFKGASWMVYGDANRNDKVNAADVSAIMKYLADWDGATVNHTAADVNMDGKVNAADVSRLMKYLAGWDVTIGPEDETEE